MYKRLIIVVVLLIFCIVISIGSFLIIETISNNIIDDLEMFLIYAEENRKEPALSAIKNCTQKIEKYEKIYDVFLDHSIFENLMITIPSILYLYETNNIDEALDKCFESIEILKIVIHEQKVCLENIF